MKERTMEGREEEMSLLRSLRHLHTFHGDLPALGDLLFATFLFQ
jgi:hypothetical protein